MRIPDHPLLAPYKAAILAAEKPTAEIILEPCDNLSFVTYIPGYKSVLAYLLITFSLF